MIAVTVTVVLLVVGVAVGVVAKLTGNVKHEDVTADDLGATRPPKVAGTAMNVLVVGSDQRNGKNAKYGRVAGERTDTIMLVHVSSKRDNAMVVSFPRDSLVQLPACRATAALPGQQAHLGMINESFNSGGIGCTWKTIESLTHIRIDHFVKVDFTGFKGIVNAVGGVDVCLPEAVNDKKALLHLPAGKQTLNGEQALGYVRARYSMGDGSDIGRIQRQQMFIASMVKKIMSGETLSDPAKLVGILDAGTKAVTTDRGLSFGVMKDLATSLQGLDAGQIRFITTPWHYSLTQPGRVEWVQPQAGRLFQIVAKDQNLQGVKGGQAKVGRSKIQIELRNGTWRSGLGTQVAAFLEQRGYHITKIGDTARKPQAKTTILYGPAGETRVPTLTADLLGGAPRELPAAKTNRLVLVIGDDWKGLKALRTDDTESIKGFDATHDTCAT
ncbi:cell envelope-related function transcriptional attenuator common domain-containing protein [Nonomuraea solani]|uniref:Cell envelope-related function transcriptional attenuator common domain-containing protein n=1 Tax=Nonomuraea solani TaxID=1144553 RepID=A0A1H6D4N2_9ACTN|nr:cell envelope-related function transcriptional attenuator common domain-containing protein [Nonomuraea solani]